MEIHNTIMCSSFSFTAQDCCDGPCDCDFVLLSIHTNLFRRTHKSIHVLMTSLCANRSLSSHLVLIITVYNLQLLIIFLKKSSYLCQALEETNICFVLFRILTPVKTISIYSISLPPESAHA